MDVLHVDCGTCIARGAACSDCVVTVLLGASGGVVDLDQDEQAALEALANSGPSAAAATYPRGPAGSQRPAAAGLAGLRVTTRSLLSLTKSRRPNIGDPNCQ